MSLIFEPTGQTWETKMGDRLKLITTGVNAGWICSQRGDGIWATYRKPYSKDDALNVLKDTGAPQIVCDLLLDKIAEQPNASATMPNDVLGDQVAKTDGANALD